MVGLVKSLLRLVRMNNVAIVHFDITPHRKLYMPHYHGHGLQPPWHQQLVRYREHCIRCYVDLSLLF